MLETTRNVNLTGKSIINGVTVENYTANINQDNPEGMTITRTILNGSVRKDNRGECIDDQVAFEDEAYAVQAEMLAAKEVAE